MDQRRAATGVGGSNDTSNMRSNDQRRYRVIADKDNTPDLVSANAAPGDRLVYDVIDADRWSLVRIERPADGGEPSGQPPTREQVAEAIAEAQNADYWIVEIREWNTREEWEREAHAEDEPFGAYEDRDHYLTLADAVLALLNGAGR